MKIISFDHTAKYIAKYCMSLPAGVIRPARARELTPHLHGKNQADQK